MAAKETSMAAPAMTERGDKVQRGVKKFRLMKWSFTETTAASLVIGNDSMMIEEEIDWFVEPLQIDSDGELYDMEGAEGILEVKLPKALQADLVKP